MILLSAEQSRKVPEIAGIVRESEATVLRWLKRHRAEGVEGLKDAPRAGRPSEVTTTYRAELLAAVRRRPRSLKVKPWWCFDVVSAAARWLNGYQPWWISIPPR